MVFKHGRNDLMNYTGLILIRPVIDKHQFNKRVSSSVSEFPLPSTFHHFRPSYAYCSGSATVFADLSESTLFHLTNTLTTSHTLLRRALNLVITSTSSMTVYAVHCLSILAHRTPQHLLSTLWIPQDLMIQTP